MHSVKRNSVFVGDYPEKRTSYNVRFIKYKNSVEEFFVQLKLIDI